jgi:5-formyltetrahydrofolate cyclo-ligase
MNSRNVTANDVSLSKSHLRSAFREKANQCILHSSLRSGQQNALNHRLKSLLKELRAGDTNSSFSGTVKWGAFQPLETEPEIRPTMRELEEAGVLNWAYPRVEGESLTFYLVTEPSTMIANRWGVLEPNVVTAVKVDTQDIQGLIIPGLAFDLRCHRLGRGRGFYDRALARLNVGTKKIGVAFETQISMEHLPTESFDVPMDWVVTESRVLQRTGSVGNDPERSDDFKTGRKNL